MRSSFHAGQPVSPQSSPLSCTHHSPLTCHQHHFTTHHSPFTIHHSPFSLQVNGLSGVRDMMSFRKARGNSSTDRCPSSLSTQKRWIRPNSISERLPRPWESLEPSIHHHFSSKDTLAQVALEEFIEDRLCRLQAMIDRYPSHFPSALDSIPAYSFKSFIPIILQKGCVHAVPCCSITRAYPRHSKKHPETTSRN